MEALFKIPASEFDERLFEKIRSILKGENGLEVTISIHHDESKGLLRRETREEYFERLLTAKANLDKGINVISFTPDELKQFEKELLGEI